LALLEVTDLKVHFATDDGIVKAVDGVSYTVESGQALGIVGESGSGKSVSSLTVMGLTRFASNARISGSVRFDGKDLLTASDEDMRRLRGNDVAMIFQDPLSSLHPFYKIGDQLVEAIQAHRDVSKAQALDRAVEMLGLVGLPEPRRRIDSYPHEFSGGMRQRVMIAMALINDPKLLIADEPTTALDVTVQAQILDLISRLQRELDTAIVMITHDLGVVAEVTDDIGVMYAGRIVEYADKETIFAMPEHPYTWGLLKSIPRLDSPRGEKLVPIPGRPPSLILKPPGCSFHPRCPYVREAHKRIDPQLAPAADAGNGGGGHRHEVACLLPGQTRRALWAALQDGALPEAALARVDVPDKVVDQAAVGEVLAPPGTEVAEGVVATSENAVPAPIEVAPDEEAS
jgi:peptide/nickel transport system ATP-binding protein